MGGVKHEWKNAQPGLPFHRGAPRCLHAFAIPGDTSFCNGRPGSSSDSSAALPVAPGPQEVAWAQTVEAAKKEGRVTLYSFFFVGDLGRALEKAFFEKYGVKLEIVTGRGAEFTERLKTEKRMGRMMADLSEGSSVHMGNMKDSGVTSSVANELPTLRQKGVWALDPAGLDPQDKHIMGYDVSIYMPYINTRLVTPDQEPKVWRDMLASKWKGQMSLTDPRIASGGYLSFVPLLREKIIDVDFLRDLGKQDLRFQRGPNEEFAALARGETKLMVRGSDTVAPTFIKEGAPIRPVEMQDGTVVGMIGAVAIAQAPHPNAAKLFLNWLLSAKGQTVHARAKAGGSIRTDVTDFRPEPLRLVPKRPVLTNNEDSVEGSRLFQEGWLNKLWGR